MVVLLLLKKVSLSRLRADVAAGRLRLKNSVRCTSLSCFVAAYILVQKVFPTSCHYLVFIIPGIFH